MFVDKFLSNQGGKKEVKFATLASAATLAD